MKRSIVVVIGVVAGLAVLVPVLMKKKESSPNPSVPSATTPGEESTAAGGGGQAVAPNAETGGGGSATTPTAGGTIAGGTGTKPGETKPGEAVRPGAKTPGAGTPAATSGTGGAASVGGTTAGGASAESPEEAARAAKTEAARPQRAAPGSNSVAAGGFSDQPPKKTPEESTDNVTGGSANTGGTGIVVGGAGVKRSGGFDTSGVDGAGAPGAALPPNGGMTRPSAKAAGVTNAYGVQGPKVWLVAADLRDLPGSSKTFEVGVPEGSKKTPWKNRAGSKAGDGIRVGSGASATFLRGFPFKSGNYDAVEFCSPGAKDCLGTQPSQIKSGVDINNSEHWLSGSDKAGKSEKGGGSFTVLFVAARGTANPNPLLEHQNGEGNAKKGPFLGWIGNDLVGSIHGSQGIVSIAAVAVPSAWTAGVPSPEIVSLRFDRKKRDLRLFALTDAGTETKSIQVPNGDGPDNDQYAAIAIGSKNPGDTAVTYVMEHLAFPRALEDRELCKIHREWKDKYGIKIPEGAMKPCGGE